MLSSQKNKNTLVLAFPAFASPSSHFPLFVSPLPSLSGSSNGTYSPLKSPAKSCSEYDFVEETGHRSMCTAGWIAHEEQSQHLQSPPLPGPGALAGGCARRAGRGVWDSLPPRVFGGLSMDRETETLPWGLSQALGWWHVGVEPAPPPARTPNQLTTPSRLAAIGGYGSTPLTCLTNEYNHCEFNPREIERSWSWPPLPFFLSEFIETLFSKSVPSSPIMDKSLQIFSKYKVENFF